MASTDWEPFNISEQTGFSTPYGAVDGAYGIIVRLVWKDNGWQVCYTNWKLRPSGWKPGMAIPYSYMPLQEYLNKIAEDCGLDQVFMANL